MLLPVRVITLVFRLVSPCFNSIAVLQIILPVSFIASAVCALVDSVTAGSVVSVVAIVDISVCVDEYSLAV